MELHKGVERGKAIAASHGTVTLAKLVPGDGEPGFALRALRVHQL